MSTLPEITQSLCMAIARAEYSRLHGLCLMAASKMGGERGERIRGAFASVQTVEGPPLKHWTLVSAPRAPWVPYEARQGLESWLQEAEYAEALASAGENVRPLLLVGPTRCGKTSSASFLALRMGVPCFRLSLADAVGSYMGESAQKMRSALTEMSRPGVWVFDELDAVTGRRTPDSSAGQERAHAIGFLLTALEQLPPTSLLIATTNMAENIDSAVRARFTELEWPLWELLSEDARRCFAESHGAPEVRGCSYAETVQKCREHRVQATIGRARQEAAE